MSLLTSSEAARRLGVKVETLYAYVSRGALTSIRSPGVRRSMFDAAEVEELAKRGRPRRTSRPSAIDFTVETRLTSIEGHTLRFRGRNAVELARRCTFEQVAQLLWTGELALTSPSWRSCDLAAAVGPSIGELQGLLARLAATATRTSASPGVYDASEVVATMVDTLRASGDGRAPRLALGSAEPLRASIAGRLWARLTPRRARPGLVSATNAALVLLADHELAPSTLAARAAASTRADLIAVVSAGMAALSGPLHGGASQRARGLLEDAGRYGVDAAIRGATTGGSVAGFGHRLYPDGDPRAAALLDIVRRAAGGSDAVKQADAVAAAVFARYGTLPNIDFALAVLANAAGMTQDAPQLLFAIARSAGWIAHAIEEYGEEPLRFRPRAVYVG